MDFIEFTPVSQDNYLIASLEMPVGSTLSYTDSISLQAEKKLLSHPQILSIVSRIEKDRAFYILEMTESKYFSNEELSAIARSVGDISPGTIFLRHAGEKNKELEKEYRILGDDQEKLEKTMEALINFSKSSPMVQDIVLRFKNGGKEIVTHTDNKYFYSFLSPRKVQSALQFHFQNMVLGKYFTGDSLWDIRLNLELYQKDKNRILENTKIPLRDSPFLPFSELQKSKIVDVHPRLYRYNKKRSLPFFLRFSHPHFAKEWEKEARNLLDNEQDLLLENTFSKPSFVFFLLGHFFFWGICYLHDKRISEVSILIPLLFLYIYSSFYATISITVLFIFLLLYVLIFFCILT